MNICGWTTWGYCDLGNDLGRARLFKHHSGIIVAVSEAHITSTEETMLMLSTMNDYLDLTKTDNPLPEQEKCPTCGEPRSCLHHVEA